jgi:hypothetical protein
LAIVPDTPMNRYSIDAMKIFEESMERLSGGSGSFGAETDRMIRRQRGQLNAPLNGPDHQHGTLAGAQFSKIS